MRCNNCGWNNPDNVSRCQKCNQTFVQQNIEIENVIANEVAIQENGGAMQRETVCMRCGYPFSSEMDICPNCGTIAKSNVAFFEQGANDGMPKIDFESIDTKSTVRMQNNENSNVVGSIVPHNHKSGFTSTLSERKEDSIESVANDALRCSKCGYPLTDGTSVCPCCNEVIRVVGNKSGELNDAVNATSVNKATVVASNEELERILAPQMNESRQPSSSSMANKATVVATNEDLEKFIAAKVNEDKNKRNEIVGGNKATVVVEGVSTPTVENTNDGRNVVRGVGGKSNSLNKTVFDGFLVKEETKDEIPAPIEAPIDLEKTEKFNYVLEAMDVIEGSEDSSINSITISSLLPIALNKGEIILISGIRYKTK